MENQKKKFGKIYDQYIGKIFRFVFLKVNSQEAAEDLTSTVFLRGWEAFKESSKIDNPGAFLYQIARNAVIDYYREKGASPVVSIESTPQIASSGPGLEGKIALSFDMEMVKKAIQNLNEDYQNAIIWRYLDDLSISEIAKISNKSEGATRVLIHRALTALKKEIKEA